MMPLGTPPALAAPAQFDPKYWDKVPRSQTKAKLTRITNKGDGFTEFVLDDGRAFQRREENLDPTVKLHVNLQVFVEIIGDKNEALVTGMWVPNVGWAFRMTSHDLAEYTKGLTALMHKQRQRAMGELKGYIATALLEGIKQQDVGIEYTTETAVDLTGPLDLDELAGYVMDAMSTAKSAGQR